MFSAMFNQMNMDIFMNNMSNMIANMNDMFTNTFSPNNNSLEVTINEMYPQNSYMILPSSSFALTSNDILYPQNNFVFLVVITMFYFIFTRKTVSPEKNTLTIDELHNMIVDLQNAMHIQHNVYMEIIENTNNSILRIQNDLSVITKKVRNNSKQTRKALKSLQLFVYGKKPVVNVLPTRRSERIAERIAERERNNVLPRRSQRIAERLAK